MALGSEIACVTDFPSGGSDADESRYALSFKTRRRDKRSSTYYDVEEAMRITGAGYVGIGTPSPDFPLKVQAVTTAFGNNQVNNLYQDSYRDLDRSLTYSMDWVRINTFEAGGGDGSLFYGNDDALGGSDAEYSAFFKGALVIPGFEIFSDRRIKTDISLVVDDTALNQVNALESYEYNYVDPFKRKKENNWFYCTGS